MFVPFLKAFVGVGVLGAGAWTIVGGYISKPGIEAFVNAQSIPLRAPGDGSIHYSVLPGGKVGRDEPVYRIVTTGAAKNDRQAGPDASASKRNLAALQGEVDDLQRMHDELDRQAEQYRTVRVRQLESRMAELKASLANALENEREIVVTNSRQRLLFEKGWTSVSVIEASDSTRVRAKLDRQAIESRVNTLTIELAAARQGTYVGDGYNDTSYSKQRADDLALRLSEKRAALARESSALEQAKKSSAAREVAAEQIDTHEITVKAPSDTIVWNILTSQDQIVKSGEPVLDLADCSRLFVRVEVADVSYAGIKQGDAATFTLNDDARELAGQVVWASSATSSGSGFYSGILDRTRVEGARFAFVIGLAGSAESRQSCPVGHMGKVTFSGAPLSISVPFAAVKTAAVSLAGQVNALSGWAHDKWSWL